MSQDFGKCLISSQNMLFGESKHRKTGGLTLLADGQFVTSFCATAVQDFATVFRRHPGTESVGVSPFTLVRLVCSFHGLSDFTLSFSRYEKTRGDSTFLGFLRSLHNENPHFVIFPLAYRQPRRYNNNPAYDSTGLLINCGQLFRAADKATRILKGTAFSQPALC